MTLPDVSNKVILISALDWGFGHTTRCVSIIESLIDANNIIVFAGNTNQNRFFRKEFPAIYIEFLDGYNIELSSKKSTYLQIIQQGFKINKAIRRERDFVKNVIAKYSVDLILSDNRYGFRNANVESVFIGHQLNLQLPKFERKVNKVLTGLVNKFDCIWIVDDEVLRLAGQLSNPSNLTIPFTFIGLLSRFTRCQAIIKYDYLVIVSGPAPENSIFLNEIESLVRYSKLRYAIVSTAKTDKNFSHVDYFYDRSTAEMNVLLNESEMVISKSGYTTLMELSVLNKKAILIPTKGQFEQEYLASHVHSKSIKFVKSINEIKV